MASCHPCPSPHERKETEPENVRQHLRTGANRHTHREPGRKEKKKKGKKWRKAVKGRQKETWEKINKVAK